MRCDDFTVIRFVGGRENQAQPEPARDLDGLQRPLALGETAEKQQVVVGNLAKTEAVGVDAVGDDDEAVAVQGRLLYATVTAIPVGPDGVDYGLIWTATDTDGNVWPRTALVLCAYTS